MMGREKKDETTIMEHDESDETKQRNLPGTPTLAVLGYFVFFVGAPVTTGANT